MANGGRRFIEFVLQRVLHQYWRFQRGMTLGVRAVVIDASGRIFLVRHGYTPGWHLPGGGVETGETFVDALRRELVEEAQIRMTGEPALHGIFFNVAVSRRDHVAVYVVRGFEQTGVPKARFEITDVGWFAPDALPPDTTPGTTRRITEVLTGIPTTLVW